MKDVTVLRKQVKKFVDTASEKELEWHITYLMPLKKMTGGMK
jgi:Uri superfamily endonuclease